MMKKKIAIISATGTARKRTIPAIQQGDLCEIVAIHGRAEEKLASLAKERGIPRFFLDVAEMLDQARPDFAYIGSPPALHAEHLRLCLQRHIPVLCEKPLCLSSTESQELIEMEATAGVPVRVAHHLRHQPGVVALQEILRGKSLGPLRRAALQWSFWLNDEASNASWKLDPVLGGSSPFYDAGIHAIDLMLHLLPSPSKILAMASPSSRFPLTHDNVSALVLCGDVIAEVNASQSLRYPGNVLSLDFERGTVYVPQALGEKAFESIQVVTQSGSATQTFPVVNPYGEEVRDFIDLLNGSPSQGTTLSEAMLALRVIEAISDSCSSGKAAIL